ncbi:MAG: multicopper oxidase family protein [Pseudomonadota bacterium]
MNRRELLFSTGVAFGMSGLGAITGAAISASARQPQQTLLTIQSAEFKLRNAVTSGLVSLSPNAPPPVVFSQQHEPVVFDVENTTQDSTAMHWHGIRLENSMDGVPYLTQMPIGEGQTFRYRFTPPDAGTYWYHPHCMTMKQMAHGLTGVLVVKEPSDPGFDVDQVINLRDFRLDNNDRLLPPYSIKKAARGGTLGNVMTANWQSNPVYEHPAGGLVRLRVVNTDTTRIYRLALEGARNKIVAWDGHPVVTALPSPTLKQPLILGPGQRADIAVLMPPHEGVTVKLLALKGSDNVEMTTLKAVGADLKRNFAQLKPLAQNPVSIPDLAAAETHEFVFGWSPSGNAPNDGFCGSLGKTFWSINRIPWPGDAAKSKGPLASLEMRKSYIFRFRNESPNLHPIHLHGLTFMPLRSNKRKIAQNWTDTALLLKGEIMEVALVADNLGDWAFHCHVIEHQKTGLSGVIRVG